MKIQRYGGVLLLFTLSILNGWAQKQVVWNEPATEAGNLYFDGFFKPYMKVSFVELKPNETVVHVQLKQRTDNPLVSPAHLAEEAHLWAEGQCYALLSVDDGTATTALTSEKNLAFHFQPLPMQTKSFDWKIGKGNVFQIKGIQAVEERWNRLFPSYWLDEKTGEWIIAFFEDKGCAIYQNQIWEMKTITKHNETLITLERDGEKLEVLVGKNKKGRRTMQIGKEKRKLAMLTNHFLPDYPEPDGRTDFVDTHFQPDTVTFKGWLKDLPDFMKNKAFNIMIEDFFYDEPVDHEAPLDSAGCFSIQIPLANSCEAFLDRGRCDFSTILEPGKTYFLLYDFKEGRRLFMGDDVRIQNELLNYPLRSFSPSMKDEKNPENFLSAIDSSIQAKQTAIDELHQLHPTLSSRYIQFCKDKILAQAAFTIGQARFLFPDDRLPKCLRQYAYEHFWKKMPHPQSLHWDWRVFINDFSNDMITTTRPTSFNIMNHLPDIASDAEELAFLQQWKAWTETFNARILAIENMEERIRYAEQINKENEAMIQRMNTILQSPKAQAFLSEQMLMADIRHYLHVLDSIGTENSVRQAILCNLTKKHLEHESRALSQMFMDSLTVWTENTPALAVIHQKNAYYKALAERQLNQLVLNTNPEVEGIKEGQAILNKLTEPYRGKFILLDIWGTWCGPCKQALSRSTEEYKRLAPYGLQYMYLANNSPKDTWETVIKEFNVTGDNVIHFNLPSEQQKAIEDYLKVKSYPTFKLIDPEGRVLDLKVDPRNLEATEHLLKQLTGN